MTLTAYNRVTIPSFMYGTAWKKEATTELVLQAVEAGFTAIDTANQLVHYDEARVGEALLQLANQGITRDKLFLQTKFTPVNGQDHRLPYDARANITTQVQQSFASSLTHLHTALNFKIMVDRDQTILRCSKLRSCSTINWRTTKPLKPLAVLGCENPTSRCQTILSIRSLKND